MKFMLCTNMLLVFSIDSPTYPNMQTRCPRRQIYIAHIIFLRLLQIWMRYHFQTSTLVHLAIGTNCIKIRFITKTSLRSPPSYSPNGILVSAMKISFKIRHKDKILCWSCQCKQSRTPKTSQKHFLCDKLTQETELKSRDITAAHLHLSCRDILDGF